MKRNIKLMMLSALMIFAAACKKNVQNKDYLDVPRIFLEGLYPNEKSVNYTDSTVFTFANLPMATTEHFLTLVARISGPMADVDRTFKIVVDPEVTTALPAEYQLPSTFVIRKNTYVANIPVTIKKTSRMDNTEVRLVLLLEDNENFKISEKSYYRFFWSNDVIKPERWDGSYRFYFGEYSKVKHRLLLGATEFKDLSQPLSATEIFYIRDAGKRVLDTYNAAHLGNPLKSESGVVIDVCRSCP